MKRTNFRIPDIIHRHSVENFTQIPNDFLRNPALSSKAKGLFCLLLSNKDGWYSHMETIQNMMADGRDSIQSGFQELQKAGYLKKFQYRDKTTKRIRGTLWVYSTIPGEFPIDEKWARMLDDKGLELINAQFVTVNGKASNWKASNWKASNWKSTPKNTNRKILKNLLLPESNDSGKESSSDEVKPSHEKLITPSQFEKFWKMYPRKVDKGKAKTTWEKLCGKKNRPTWKTIVKAVLAQRKSERWQDSKYIPYPSTWLNNQRWLDDPAEMKLYKNSFDGAPPNSVSGQRRHAVDADSLVKQELGHLAEMFHNHCVNFAIEVFDEEREVLVPLLVELYKAIDQIQRKAWDRNPSLNGILPGPIELIKEYLRWINEQTWITDVSVQFLAINHKIFQRFCREHAKTDAMDRHPLTGKPV